MRLTEERWQAVQNLRSPSAPTDGDNILEHLDRVRPHVGHIGILDLYAFVAEPELILSHVESAPWSSSLAALGEYEDQMSYSEDEDPDPETKRRNSELARQLATNPRFPKARNFEKRCYLANLLFKMEDLSRDDIVQIVRDAEIIYDVEIKS